jgi:hypothetical protein
MVTPHLDNVYLTKNIKTEQSYSMLESTYLIFKDLPKMNFSFDKTYSAYMYRPDESRGRLLDTLIKNNLLDNGHVTYHQPDIKVYDDFAYYNQEPLMFAKEEYSKDSHDHFVTPVLYENSFVDIVPETSFWPGSFFITEKTLRPLYHKKPFLTIGPQHFYKKYFTVFFGLELYDEVFDYSFDNEPDLQKRIDGVVENIVRIKNAKPNDLRNMYNLLKPKLEYNKSRLDTIYNDINKIVPKCMQMLLSKDYEYELHGLCRVSLLYLIRYYRKIHG